MTDFEIPIIRAKRKTIGIYIKQDASVLVKAPQKVSLKAIHNFINLKQTWIKKTLIKIQARPKKLLLVNQQQKDLFLFGKKLSFEQLEILSATEAKDLQVKELELYLKTAIKKFAAQLHLPEINYKIVVKQYKSRWGNCRYKQSKTFFQTKSLPTEVILSFNLQLHKFSTEVLDYVILHELCHIYQPNHSQKFWNLVADHMPNYKDLKLQLKQAGL